MLEHHGSLIFIQKKNTNLLTILVHSQAPSCCGFLCCDSEKWLVCSQRSQVWLLYRALHL